MKKILTVVLLVAIILAAFTVLSTSIVRADTSEANVLTYSWYVAPANAGDAGDLVAVGEIQNVGSSVLQYVYLSGFAYNSTGALLDVSQVQAYVYDMLPGQKAPFYLDFTPENSATGDQQWVPSASNVTVVVADAIDTTSTQYAGLAIPTGTVTSYHDSSGIFTVTGNVQNTGDTTTGNVWVVTTFYDASGTVVSLNFTNFLTTSLAPGNSINFLATPLDNTAQLSSEITNYSFLVQSTPLTTTSPTATTSTSSSSTPTSSAIATTQPTQSTNPLSSGLTYAIVGAIVVVLVVVVIAVLLMLRKRNKNAQPPPATTPPTAPPTIPPTTP